MIEILAALAVAAPGDSLVFEGSEGELRVRPPRVESPGIAVDGRLQESVWSDAARLSGFTQYEPTEGIAATEPTEVLVFYGGEAIYFGVRAHDSRPDRIRSSVAERDESIFDDDWVRLMLDTYNRQQQAYVFYVNPRGIQTDGLWIEGMDGGGGGPGVPVDFNPDFIWQSEGRVTDGGWTAEVRIPYVSLRFREDGVQNWGFNVAREIRRLGYTQSWAPLSQSVSSTLEQQGTLAGLRGLEPRRLREVTPVVTGRWSGDRANGSFRRSDPEPQVGLNARYGLTQNMVLGATVNPDFSQVEADAGQIRVNERFALFFPEKRPFFLEGTEVFNTPSRLVHTRRVVDPIAGAKVTGRQGPVEVGYLGALDESPVSLGDAEHEAAFNLFRASRDMGGGSSAGVLYTDRSSLGGADYNRVASGDARLRFGDRYSLTGQVAGSWTAERDAEDPGFAPLLSARMERTGRELAWQLEFEDVHPDFRAESGLIRRIGDARLFGQGEVNFFTEPGSFLQSVGFQLRTMEFFDHSELWDLQAPFEAEVEFQPEVSFRGGHRASLLFRDGYFRFRPETYESYRVEGPDGSLRPFETPASLSHMLAGMVTGSVRFSEAVRIRGRTFLRQVPIYSEAALGREFQVNPTVSLQPTDEFSLDASYALSRIWRERNGTLFSRADIPRLETQYMFSRWLFARAIVQYDLQGRDGLLDPRSGRQLWVDGEPAEDVSDGQFQAQLLVSYEPSPGTIFFVGYTRQEEGRRTYSLSRMDPVSDRFFVKASYLTRF